MRHEGQATVQISDSGGTDRYIPLLPELYSLRHKIPSLLHYLLLECQRCFQWIPVEVISSIPEELPYSALEARGERWIVPKRERNDNEGDGAEEEHVWHSPRLRAHQGNQHAFFSSFSSLPHERSAKTEASRDGVHSEGAVLTERNDSVVNPPLYIPNPQCFVCNGTMCEKGDRLLTLRSDWLRALYASCLKEGHGQRGTTLHVPDASTSQNSEHGRLQLENMMNTKLAEELDIRRSERLAGRKRHQEQHELGEYSSFDGSGWVERRDGRRRVKIETDTETMETAVGPPPSSTGSSSSLSPLPNDVVASTSAFLRQKVKETFQDDTALSSAFCWVVCDVCGKMRRTAQPFPGGAPFICALSVARRCTVSEAEGLRLYNQRYSERIASRISLLSSGPAVHFPFLFEDAVEAGVGTQEPLPFSSYQSEPLLRWIIAHHHRFSSGAPRPTGVKKDRRHKSSAATSSKREAEQENEMYFPVLKALTTAIRKKSISTFVKKMVLDPAEIRRKRERIGCSMFLEGATSSEAPKSKESTELPSDALVPSTTSVKQLNVIDEELEVELSGPGVAPVKTKQHTGRDTVVADPALHHSNSHAPSSSTVQQADVHPLHLNKTSSPYSSCKTQERKNSLKREEKTETVALAMKADGKSAVGLSRRPRKSRENTKEEIIYWIQCDKCDKWRIVPRPIKPKTWECSMRPGTTCEDSDDAKDGEY